MGRRDRFRPFRSRGGALASGRRLAVHRDPRRDGGDAIADPRPGAGVLPGPWGSGPGGEVWPWPRGAAVNCGLQKRALARAPARTPGRAGRQSEAHGPSRSVCHLLRKSIVGSFEPCLCPPPHQPVHLYAFCGSRGFPLVRVFNQNWARESLMCVNCR